MRPVYAHIFLPHLLPSGAVGRQTAHTHPHNVLVQILHTQIRLIQIPHQQVRVRRYLIVLVIQSPPAHHLAPDVHRRMQRQPAALHFPFPIVPANPVAHGPVRVLKIHEQSVAIYQFGPCFTEFSHNIRNDMPVEQKII